MAVAPIKLPKDLASFVQGTAAADIVKMEQLLNALQNLRVQVSINGTTRVVQTSIQISGGAALISIQL